MVNFYYPETLSEALELKESLDVMPLAGGTDLMVRYENWSSLPAGFPGDVMSVGQLRELQYIREEDGFLRIGGGLPMNRILEDRRIPRTLALGMVEIAAPALRNLATLAGNIQNASPAADSLPPLLVAGASLNLVSSKSSRVVRVQEFITGPGKTGLRSDELIESILIPLDFIQNESRGTFLYRKVGTRKANALSKLSVCFWVFKENGCISDIRLALGAVSAVVLRLEESENRMKGVVPKELPEVWKQVRDDYERAVRPIDDQRSTAFYRKRTALRLLDAFVQDASEI